jgi:hypothetical protein
MARSRFVRCRAGWLGIFVLALLGALPSTAQTEPAPEAGGGGPATEAQPSSGGQIQASEVPWVTKAQSSDREHPNRAALGDGLTVQVTQGTLKPALDKLAKGCESLILFLNEIPIKGVPPDSCSLAKDEIHFTLDRTDESDQAWHILLEEPIAFNRIVSVSVGPQGGLSFPTKKTDFELIVLPRVQFYAYFVGLALFLMLFLRLAIRTPLLRDRGLETPPGKLPPYSLSRFQMAFWSFLIIAAYLFIWIITKELDTITGSVLALLGIGSATALGAKLIDTGKATAAAAAGNDGGEQPQPAAAPPPPPKGTVSKGFLHDVLSDAAGISLYRFQLFAWTWVLGIIFIASVYHGLQMPQFNPTLLGLMGISSGTYLGFKVPESRAGTE